MKTVSTSKGRITLTDPSIELLRTIRAFLPFGAVRYAEPQSGADFGIVMQCGERHVSAAKRQPVDCDARTGQLHFLVNGALIARAIPTYLQHGYSGLLMPCAYMRQKADDRVESGVAFFGSACASGCEVREASNDFGVDAVFGIGFNALLKAFLHALQKAADETGLPLQRPVGLDIRERPQLGHLGFGLMVVGRTVVCLKTNIEPEDPVWTHMSEVGLTELVHVPSLPAGIREEQLSLAKAIEQAS